MTQDEIIKLAKEAGLTEWEIGTGENRSSTQGRRLLRLERFASIVRSQTLCEAAAIVLMSPSREAAVDVLQEMGK